MGTDDFVNPNTPRGSKLMRFFPRNWISEAGMTLALVSIGNIVIFTVIDMVAAKPNPYVGILSYMIAHGFLNFSLALIAIGYWQSRRAVVVDPYPRVDLNDPIQLAAVFVFVAFQVVFVLISAAGIYKAYEYTDS